MKGTKRIARGMGKVIVVLFGVVFMPMLIWVALGAAVRQGIPRRATHTTGEILATT
ncbi:MAG: hypothetical protein HW402_11 [Dehalococcoidales bacterium]|nr:hypothetical protein [Dehalococcoidales bacterium]